MTKEGAMRTGAAEDAAARSDDDEDAEPHSIDEGADDAADDDEKASSDGGDAISKFRALLSSLERESQRSYDKAVLTLSGGALGVTVSFLKNVIHGAAIHLDLLALSWICWGISLSCVLYSFYASNLALRKALLQLDAQTIGQQRPGGAFDILTAILNFAAGALFLVGILLFVIFAFANLGDGHG
jgi:hypothetical protein